MEIIGGGLGLWWSNLGCGLGCLVRILGMGCNVVGKLIGGLRLWIK